MVTAIAAGAAVSATVGTLSLRLGSVIATGAAPDVWRTWWLGDFAGALVVLPVALAWYRPLPTRWPLGRAIEGALMVVAVAAASEVAFHSREPVAYLVFPTLTWAALRFGERGATLAITIAVGSAVWNTTHEEGPFAFRSLTHSVLATQLYLAVAALSTLFLVAVVTERKAFAGGWRRLARAWSRPRRPSDGAWGEPPRRGSAAPDGARRPAGTRRRGRPPRPRAERAAPRGGGRRGHARHRGAAPDRAWHPPGSAQPRPRGRDQERRRPVIGPVCAILDLPSERLDDTAEATAYYVLAEAATNAQRYAQASLITVRATWAPPVLRIEIVDDGIGGAHETVGFGLEGLRNRVEALGGRFRGREPRRSRHTSRRGDPAAAAVPPSAQA